MGSRARSTVGCLPELRFLQFSVAQVFVGLRMKIINNFVIPAWACAAGSNNNNRPVYLSVLAQCATANVPDQCTSVYQLSDTVRHS